MKIGVFLPDISPQSGGAFTFVETILSGIAALQLNNDDQAKDEYHVFYYGKTTHLKSVNSQNIHFHSLSSNSLLRFFKKFYYFYFSPFLQYLIFNFNRKLGLNFCYPYASSLDRVSKKKGIDLMWFPTPNYENVDVPYMITIWDLEHRAQPYFPEVSINGEWEGRERHFKKIIQRASYIITGTEIGKQEICQFYGAAPERIRILPHPTPEFALASHANYKNPSGVGSEPFVFYPAQFWSHKNHYTLLKAVAALKQKNKTLNCVLVGSDKGNLQYIKELTKKFNIEKQVIFPGFVTREELIALYQNALAMVYPSLCGPENLPPLEAMALGCPVIANQIAGAREQLGDAALLVDYLNADEISAAILKMLEAPAHRSDLIKRGKQRALKFTSKQFINEFSGILEQFRSIRNLWN